MGCSCDNHFHFYDLSSGATRALVSVAWDSPKGLKHRLTGLGEAVVLCTTQAHRQPVIYSILDGCVVQAQAVELE